MLTLHKEAPRSKLYCIEKFHEGVYTAITNSDSGAVRIVDIWELVSIPEIGKSINSAGILLVADKSLIIHSKGLLPFCPAQIIHGLCYQPFDKDFLELKDNGLSFNSC